VSVDRTKVLEAAQKHLAKGNYDKAILEYRKIVDATPSDLHTWLKIGDLYARKGARREAIDIYTKVGSQYGEQGFFLKAVAVYKQILKLDPSRLDVQVKLGEMYEMLQLTSEALSTYEQVAGSYARAGDIDRALAMLAKMTEINPDNIPVRIKYAEALSKAGRTKEAASAFEAGATLLKEQGRLDDYMKVAERLLFHRPEDVKLARELASMYLERKDAKHALPKLQACFKADSKDIATLELLAEAFNQLGQLPKTISVYREVARLHQEANRADERARTLKKILELDPGDAEARQALASFAGAQQSVRRDIAPPASAVVEPSRAAARAPVEEPELEEEPEELEEEPEDELEVLDEDEEEILLVEEEPAVEESASVAPPARPSVPADVQREAQIARLLTECDVFMRYGLKQKVVEQLHSVLELDPGHVEARERLKELYLGQGNVAAAVGELLQLADILAGERSAAAVLYLREALVLDPGNALARARLSELGAPVDAARSAPVSVAPSGVWSGAAEEPIEDRSPDELAPRMPAVRDEQDDVFFLEEEGTEQVTATAPAEPVEATVASVPRPTPVPMARSFDEADEPVPVTATDAAPLYLDDEPTAGPPLPRVAVPPPASAELRIPRPLVPKPAVSAPSEPPLDLLAPMTPEEFDEVPLRPSTPALAAEGARRSIAPGEIEDMLDEADFFVAQGLFEEARGMLGDALRNHPGHVLIEEKLREVAQLANAAAAERSASSIEAPADQSFELAEKLAAELDEPDAEAAGSDVLDVEQVFAQFKKGVEQQVAMEDSETHFDLGIAYKEMGLLDDAINEFRLCLTNPQRVCIAETMIGICHIERGDVSQAIVHFKRGLYADTKTDREELGLYFELGNAYDLLHDPKEALYYYQKVHKRDPGFRGVIARIQALTQPQAPQAAQPMAPDDIDRAFDDLMGED
jgi:tetratricopeptide (TPR) repeat protein